VSEFVFLSHVMLDVNWLPPFGKLQTLQQYTGTQK